MTDEPMPIETYAKILAHLVCHRDQPLENVLGGLGVTTDQLHAADAHWNERLSASFRQRKGVLAMTFASAFAEARSERGLFGGGAKEIAPAPRPAAHDPVAMPSYMAAGPAAPWSQPASALAAAPPPPAPPPPAPPPPAPPPSVSAASPAPPPVQQSPSTKEFPVAPPAPPASALPFQVGAPQPAIAAPSKPAAPASGGLGMAGQGGLGSAGQGGLGTGTTLSSPDTPRQPDTPWEQAGERVGKLTLAHFAALSVEVWRNPPDLTPILRRYGLQTTDDLRHVSAAFHAQMQVDPALRAQFDSLVARMRSMGGKREGG